MTKKDYSLKCSILLYIVLCLYSYYYVRYELPLLPEPTNDPDWVIRGVTYPLSFVFNFVISVIFFVVLKLGKYTLYLFKKFFKGTNDNNV